MKSECTISHLFVPLQFLVFVPLQFFVFVPLQFFCFILFCFLNLAPSTIRPKKIIVWLSSTTFFEKGRAGRFALFIFAPLWYYSIRPKKSCLVVLYHLPLILKKWEKVFTVQKYTAPNFWNSKKCFFFLFRIFRF